MTAAAKPLAEITAEAIRLLCREIGPVNTEADALGSGRPWTTLRDLCSANCENLVSCGDTFAGKGKPRRRACRHARSVIVPTSG